MKRLTMNTSANQRASRSTIVQNPFQTAEQCQTLLSKRLSDLWPESLAVTCLFGHLGALGNWFSGVTSTDRRPDMVLGECWYREMAVGNNCLVRGVVKA